MKSLIIALIFFSFSIRAFSQQVSTVEFHGDTTYKEFQVRDYKSLSNGLTTEFQGELINNTIVLNLNAEFAKEVLVTYNQQTFPVFIKPGDSVLVDYKDGEPHFSNSKDCEFAYQYQLLTKEKDISTNFKEIDPKDYLQAKDEEYALASNLLNKYKSSISAECYSYYNYENIFKTAYDKLFFRRHQRVGLDYYTFLNGVPLNLNSPSQYPYYRTFVNEYLIYKQAVSKHRVSVADVILKRTRIKQYKFSKTLFEGPTLEYIRATRISKAIEDMEHYGSIYKHFKKTYPDSKFLSNFLFEKSEAIRISQNKLAPQFSLESNQGDTVKLSDLRGRVVYLIFWGSYCAPCIEKFPLLNTLQEDFTDKDISFVYISMDNNPETWKKSISKYKLNGIQLRANWNEIGKLYNFAAIPNYVVINKEGELSGFQHPDNQNLKSILKNLSNK